MITIDARGLSCPQPVLLTKQALDAHPEGCRVYWLMLQPLKLMSLATLKKQDLMLLLANKIMIL